MRPETRELLRCPMCHSNLDLEDGEGQEPEGMEDAERAPDHDPGGRLSCTGCDRWYPLFNGIPMMLPGHEDNLGGNELSTQFRNPPGIAPRRRKWMGWYYNSPRKVSGTEEGDPGRTGYSDIKGTVLDLGAGDRNLEDRLKGIDNYISMDIIPRDRPTVVADAHLLPFRDGSFDAVIATALLEHVEDEQKVVSEVSRVLRPGGVFIFSAPFMYPIHDAVDHHRFTIYSLRALAGKNAFSIAAISSIGGYFGVLAQHIYQGLKMQRDFIDSHYKKRPVVRKLLRCIMDIAGMIIYLPFYLLIPLDRMYRDVARREQGRVPFVKGYNAVFEKK